VASQETWTIGRLIRWAAGYLEGYGVESPRLSGELLLAQVLDCPRVELYLRFDQPLTPAELAAFKELILRRRRHEPVAYILGRREFYGLELAVGPGVLVPRPETEHLVERALQALEGRENPRVLDLCTGCGAVALALAREREDAQVVGVDISAQALEYARANARKLGLADRVHWLQGSLWEPLAAAGGFFELITANPPYVAEDQWDGLPPQVREFEPRLALDGGHDGLDLIRDIIGGARAFLRAGAWLLLELGQGQARAAAGLARAAGVFDKIESARDLAGVERVLACRRGDYG